MTTLQLPPYDAKVTERDGESHIWDDLRRRYVALTPEEWVRQHFVHYLLEHRGYPVGLLANEVSIRQGRLTRRCDTILYEATLPPRPRMIIEYKAPDIRISQQTFDQIYRYNLVLRADYLVVSNGLAHYCCHIDYANNRYTFLPQVPIYQQL